MKNLFCFVLISFGFYTAINAADVLHDPTKPFDYHPYITANNNQFFNGIQAIWMSDNTDESRVMINNHCYKIGDILYDDYKVIAIATDSITLCDQHSQQLTKLSLTNYQIKKPLLATGK